MLKLVVRGKETDILMPEEGYPDTSQALTFLGF
jgi:hypothetical protein